jgi:predicted nucleic acid-binding protein
VIYLDSSALLKLVYDERETEALRGWLGAGSAPRLTSELGRVEVLRASRRNGRASLARGQEVIGDVELVPLNRRVQDLAAGIGSPRLRTLDALHLASAVILGDELTAFVAYDQRLQAAARDLELPVHSPA